MYVFTKLEALARLGLFSFHDTRVFSQTVVAVGEFVAKFTDSLTLEWNTRCLWLSHIRVAIVNYLGLTNFLLIYFLVIYSVPIILVTCQCQLEIS